MLGSGDQAFHFLNRDAKSVDVFDINRLSIYYYYLRIWLIKYMNEFYPNDFNYDRIDSEKKLNIGHYYAKK